MGLIRRCARTRCVPLLALVFVFGLAGLEACSANAPPAEPGSGIERVEIALDPAGLQILDTRAASALARDVRAEPALLYELRDDQGTLVASGRVEDPRHLHAEWLEGSSMKRANLQKDLASVVLYLRTTPGSIRLYGYEQGNKQEMGSVRYTPKSAAIAQQPLTNATTIHQGSGKLKLVLISEGYTSSELTQFAEHSKSIVDALMASPDWGAQKSEITIDRVDIASKQSGIDDPVKKIKRDTYFDTAPTRRRDDVRGLEPAEALRAPRRLATRSAPISSSSSMRRTWAAPRACS